MNRPRQVVPSFVSTFLLADQTLTGAGTWDVVLFDIVEPDGSTTGIYDSTTGEFTAPCSGWFDIESQLQSSAALAGGVRIVRNGDTSFPLLATISTDTINTIKRRIRLSIGETVRIEANGTADVLANAGTTPDARASYAMLTMVKRFEDSEIF